MSRQPKIHLDGRNDERLHARGLAEGRIYCRTMLRLVTSETPGHLCLILVKRGDPTHALRGSAPSQERQGPPEFFAAQGRGGPGKQRDRHTQFSAQEHRLERSPGQGQDVPRMLDEDPPRDHR